MVEVKNIEVFGLERAIQAIGNSYSAGEINTTQGKSDSNLAKFLGGNDTAHQSHDAFLKGILVSFDIKGNGAFMPEFQRYHFMEIIMSQSTMHSMDKFMSGSNFSPYTKYITKETKKHCKENYEAYKKIADDINNLSHIESFSGKPYLNDIRRKELLNKKYEAFMVLIHNLPRGFELWATCSTNYLQLKTIVIQRFHHKMREDWMNFISACYSMPRFRELCGFDNEKWDLTNW